MKLGNHNTPKECSVQGESTAFYIYLRNGKSSYNYVAGENGSCEWVKGDLNLYHDLKRAYNSANKALFYDLCVLVHKMNPKE